MEYVLSCVVMAAVLFMVWKVTKNFIKMLISFVILGALIYFGWPYLSAFF